MAIRYHITTTGLDTLLAKVTKGQSVILKGVPEMVKKACRETERTAKARAPVDTGNLKNEIHSKVTGGSASTEGEVISDAGESTRPKFYSEAQEVGTRFNPPMFYMKTASEMTEPVFQKDMESLIRKVL